MRNTSAFTLIELLAVIAVIGILTSLGFAGYGDIRSRKNDLECASRLRALGQSVLLYAGDSEGRFPQSGHSGSSWATAVAPYLGQPQLDNPLDYRERTPFVCPLHAETDASAHWSYGLNVFFELSAQLRYTPAGLPILGSRDNYSGSPETWHRLGDIPAPSATVLLAENAHPVADHFMAHQWSAPAAARNAVASGRHDGKSHYAFVDGHVERLAVEKTFDPASGIDRWHPLKAALAAAPTAGGN